MSALTATISSKTKSGAKWTPMDPTWELVSIDISKEINRIPDAQLVLLDGDAAQGKFVISDDPFFEPGMHIQIKLRYEGGTDVIVFTGVIVRHGVEVSTRGSTLTVDLKDAAVSLTRPRKSKVFTGKTDAQIITMLLGEADVAAGTIATTAPEHPEIVQYHATDWDFIVSRADAMGLVVVADDGSVSVQAIALSGNAKHTFKYGFDEIYDFDLEVDASGQPSAVSGTAWTIADQQPSAEAKAAPFELAQGNLDGAKLADTIGFAPDVLAHTVPTDAKELQAWADARMIRGRMSMLRGRLAVPGNGDIKPMDLIELSGVGARFDGKTVITGVRHRVTDRGWQTDLQFGLPAEPYGHQLDIPEYRAAGLVPPVNGLQIGVVDKFEDDPTKELRVKVKLPTIDAKLGSVWARLATPDAGKQRGYFFRPEVGDEVVVGFLADDPRQPVILGSLFSSANAPPAGIAPAADNLERAIVSKNGVTIGIIDGEKPSFFVETPASNTIVLSDDADAGVVGISDQHGNAITMNKDGIVIESAKDLTLQAAGNVEIKGKKVDVV